MKRLALIVALALGSLTACQNFPAAVDEAERTLEETRIALNEAEAEIERLEKSGEATKEELKDAKGAVDKAKEAERVASEALTLVKQSRDDLPSFIEGTSKAIGASTGQVEIGLIGLFIASLIRARRNRQIADNIVQSVEPIMEKAEPEDRARVRSIQTPAAKKVVDQAQGKKSSLGF